MSVAAVARRVDALQAELVKLRNEIPSAIAQGIRVHADRPAGELGAPSLRFGTVDGVFEDEGYATVVLDGQTESVPVMMLGGLLENERVAVMFYPDGGSLALGMVNPATVPPISGVPAGGTGGQALVKIDGTDYNDAWADVVHSVVAGTNITVDNTDPQNPIIAATAGGSGFPVGPFDDTVGTHEVLTATSGGIISAMIGRTTSDSAPTESAYWQVAISDALGAASFGGKGTAPDGSYGEVSVGGLGSAYGSVSLVAQGNGAASPAILTMLSHVSGGASEIDFSSDTVEFDANTGITFNTPVFQIHGATASPTIGTASEFAFWLDDTPGATVLHFKAKDSGGTVRNGSIALT